jgi:hypothetical protein
MKKKFSYLLLCMLMIQNSHIMLGKASKSASTSSASSQAQVSQSSATTKVNETFTCTFTNILPVEVTLQFPNQNISQEIPSKGSYTANVTNYKNIEVVAMTKDMNEMNEGGHIYLKSPVYRMPSLRNSNLKISSEVITKSKTKVKCSPEICEEGEPLLISQIKFIQ